ncbi:hypothetical protein CYY_005123 [Polysphondylium violaceum]|uniref:Carbohydrate binding domain-containing protein n=1 Tax=Polysphondylium violaceum TaxID=133409 RepID=A0A8J4V750_9MYCE|nr:hypothetical protein CYY_005123 [Polysphondylium violaceum]
MSTHNKLLVFLLFILSCLFISTSTADVLPYNFDFYGCSYTTHVSSPYEGNYSEFDVTTNNGTMHLPMSLSEKWSIMTPITLTFTLIPGYEPPVIFHYQGKTYDITKPFIGCIYEYSKLTQIGAQDVNFTLFSDPMNGQTFDIYVDDVKVQTKTIPPTKMDLLNTFTVNIPYNQPDHIIKLVQVSNNQSFLMELAYVGPLEITSFQCTRGFIRNSAFEDPRIVNYCKFVGNRLPQSFRYLNGLEARDIQTSLTSINVTLLSNLPLGALISFEIQTRYNYFTPIKTTTYFQPHPLPSQSTFIYGRDPLGYITATIQGTYLDAVLLNQSKFIHDGKTSMINCQYSFFTSLEKGYQESITCTIPQINDYKGSTISLTPTYYPSTSIVLTPDKSEASSSSFTLPSMLFIVTLLSSMFFNSLF